QAERHRVLSLPSAEGGIGGAVAGLGPLASARDLSLWHAAGLSDRLPAQSWHLATQLPPSAATRFLLGWLMGAYRMSRYRLDGPERPRAPRRWRAISSTRRPTTSGPKSWPRPPWIWREAGPRAVRC